MKLHKSAKLNTIHKLVLSGLFAALTVLITLLSIPLSGGGYIHLGDTAIFAGVYVIGGVWGILAGAVGSALTDLILGYAIYIPATFVIKGLMALTATALLARASAKWRLPVFVTACLIVPVGYFLYEAIIYGDALVAALNTPYNLLQAILSAILGFAIIVCLDRVHAIKH